jgi:2'-5' RNA ligase
MAEENIISQMRLFLAIPLPSELQKRLLTLQDELASSDWQLSLTPPENLHLTLHFLGETPENLLEDFHKDLSAMANSRRPFDLAVGGLGAFPSWENPRVIWVGLRDASKKLEELFEASYAILKGYRMFDLKREFTPHLTLGRVKELRPYWDPRRIQGLMGQWEKLGNLPVEEVLLMHSHGGSEGSRYEVLQSYRLGGGPAPTLKLRST